ncbi:hypothetical protein ZIOFF_011046 [Zingiber officinale]|uniref:Retrotransposon gag domain-containing protein n=1 Tax=Zingiber officinale TaxID=94328 RepID=A0A8J5HMT3_ZINOF|nr:hypothetical protein ZIOFF_011046 [Zingiber officinale]
MPPRRYIRRNREYEEGRHEEAPSPQPPLKGRQEVPPPLPPHMNANTRMLEEETWEGFKQILYKKYFTADVRSRVKREFINLRQRDLSLAEYVRKFDKGCHFVPLIANDAEEKLRHFLDDYSPRSSDGEPDEGCLDGGAFSSGKIFPLHPSLNGHLPVDDVPKAKESGLGIRLRLHLLRWKLLWSHSPVGGVPKAKVSSNSGRSIPNRQKHFKFRQSIVFFMHVSSVERILTEEVMLSTDLVKNVELRLQKNIVRADLIVLPMPEFDIILDIDWLTLYGASIDFDRG